MLKLSFLLFASAILTLTTAQTFYTYKTVGNVSIEAAVYVSNITVYPKFPVVLVIHGGGFISNSCTQGDLSAQELLEMLARGWVVVSIDYRLLPGALLQDMIQDVQDAYNWIRTELVNTVNINPDAIAVWGDSAGAGLAVISGYKLNPRPQAVIAFYPYLTNFTSSSIYNPSTPLGQDLVNAANALREPAITEYDFLSTNDPRVYMLSLAITEEKIGWLLTTTDPNASPESIINELMEYSAVYNIDPDYPPTYLIHGLNDTVVSYEQSVEMAAVLQNAGVSYELVLVPGAEHAFDLGGVSLEIWSEYILPIFDFTQNYIAKFSATTAEITN